MSAIFVIVMDHLTPLLSARSPARGVARGSKWVRPSSSYTAAESGREAELANTRWSDGPRTLLRCLGLIQSMRRICDRKGGPRVWFAERAMSRYEVWRPPPARPSITVREKRHNRGSGGEKDVRPLSVVLGTDRLRAAQEINIQGSPDRLLTLSTQA